jgi:hypothetical protein
MTDDAEEKVQLTEAERDSGDEKPEEEAGEKLEEVKAAGLTKDNVHRHTVFTGKFRTNGPVSYHSSGSVETDLERAGWLVATQGRDLLEVTLAEMP